MKLLDFFARHPVFTHEEFASFLDAEGSRSLKTQEALLAYHVKTGRILRVRRGLYASVPFGASPDTFPVDTFLLAGKMAEDAVLGYHTALEFLGKAHSVQERFVFLTSKAIRPVNFRGYEFRGVRFPNALVKRNQEFFAVDKAERAGLPVRVTSLERILVDILDRPDLGGGWEEIWRSLESVEFFDTDKVVDYTLLLDNASTAAKVGLYLEQHQKDLMVDDAHLDRLRQCIPKQPTYMARNSKGRLVRDWNLVVPSQVLERAWEEIS
jgi:predicted transcriptional regulator of viral defense system